MKQVESEKFNYVYKKNPAHTVNLITKITQLDKTRVKQILESTKFDKDCLNNLRNIKPKKHKKNGANKFKYRWDRIRKEIEGKVIARYLDFGGGDCQSTEYIGKMLGLSKLNCVCADVREWMEDTNLKRTEMSYTFSDVTDQTIDYVDNHFDLITVYHVLHHIPTYKQSYDELLRVLKPNGILILREHDYTNKKVHRYLIDIEHMIWSIVMNGNSYDQYVAEYYGKYRSEEQWKQLFCKDFDLISTTPPRGVTRSFYHTYVKKMKNN